MKSKNNLNKNKTTRSNKANKKRNNIQNNKNDDFNKFYKNMRRRVPRNIGYQLYLRSNKINGGVGRKNNAMTKNTATNITTITNNNKSNFKDKKLRMLSNPMEAVLNNSLYSIFPCDERVIRLSLFTKYYINVNSGAQYDFCMCWYPLGVGFTDLLKDLRFVIDGETSYADSFCSLMGCYYNSSSNQQNIKLYPKTLCNIKGKYRVIGNELKISNTTNVTNRGGSYMCSKMVLDSPYPSYFVKAHDELIMSTVTLAYKHVIEAFGKNQDQQSIKQIFTSDNIALLKYVNCDDDNKLFNDYDEYIQVPYLHAGGVQYMPLTASAEIGNYGAIGNSVVWKINFAVPTANQTYLAEEYTVIEVIPDPDSNLGNVAQKSFQSLTKNQKRYLSSMSQISRI